MQPDKQKLIHHISRLEGQLASLKRELENDNPDCAEASHVLKASARSFSSLRMAFVSCFLKYKYLTKQQSADSTYNALINVINS